MWYNKTLEVKMKLEWLLISVFFLAIFFSFSLFSQEEKEDEDNFFIYEEKFCQISDKEGIKEAFENLGDKTTLIVQSNTISFKEWFIGLEEEKTIQFYPSQMVCSASEDFGFSLGVWKEERDSKLGIWGNYLNVWKKVGKSWKIIYHSKTVLPPRISFQKPKSCEKIELSSERKPSQDASKVEAEMFEVLKSYGWAKVYNEYADENIFRLRSDSLLERGKKSIFIKSVAERGYIEGKVIKEDSSKSKDLVLFYGSAKTGGPQISAKGSFIHIWVKNSEGNYKLLVDFFASERFQDKLRKKLL